MAWRRLQQTDRYSRRTGKGSRRSLNQYLLTDISLDVLMGKADDGSGGQKGWSVGGQVSIPV